MTINTINSSNTRVFVVANGRTAPKTVAAALWQRRQQRRNARAAAARAERRAYRREIGEEQWLLEGLD